MPSAELYAMVSRVKRVCRACGHRRVLYNSRKPFCNERCASQAWVAQQRAMA